MAVIHFVEMMGPCRCKIQANLNVNAEERIHLIMIQFVTRLILPAGSYIHCIHFKVFDRAKSQARANENDSFGDIFQQKHPK